MQATFVVHVEDRPGVLNRVSSLVRRRGYNIESLTVGRTETPGLSRMTIVVDTDESAVARLCEPRQARQRPPRGGRDLRGVGRSRPRDDQGDRDRRDAKPDHAAGRRLPRARRRRRARFARHRDHGAPRTRWTACWRCCGRTASSRWRAPAASPWSAAQVRERQTATRATSKQAAKQSHIRCRPDLPPSLKLRRTAVALAEAVRSGVRERARCELERNDMATMYYDKDADIALVRSAKVAVLGYGSRGHAHALNLKDSGVDVRVGLHERSSSRERARAAGLTGRLALRGGGLGRHHRHPRAGHESAGALPRCDCTASSPRQNAALCARVQHPLRDDSAARRGGRRDDRAEVAGPSSARAVRRRGRNTGAPRGPSGRERPREGAGALIRAASA